MDKKTHDGELETPLLENGEVFIDSDPYSPSNRKSLADPKDRLD